MITTEDGQESCLCCSERETVRLFHTLIPAEICRYIILQLISGPSFPCQITFETDEKLVFLYRCVRRASLSAALSLSFTIAVERLRRTAQTGPVLVRPLFDCCSRDVNKVVPDEFLL